MRKAIGPAVLSLLVVISCGSVTIAQSVPTWKVAIGPSKMFRVEKAKAVIPSTGAK